MYRTTSSSWLARPLAGARHLLVGLIVVVLLLAAQTTLAQSTGPDEVDDHPIVGAWVVTDALYPEAVPSTTVAHPDGTVVFFREDGPFSGVWEPRGADGAIVTLVSTRPEGMVTLRADVTVAADGETFMGTYTAEPACLCGETLGQLGPGQVAGSRIHVEAPGEPVAPLPSPEPSDTEAP